MKRSTKKSRRSATSRGRLGVQQLESRKLMAADIGLSDSILSIQGTDADDIAEVYVDSDQVHVTLSSYDSSGEMLSQNHEAFAVDQIGRIIFDAGAGDDMLVNDSAIPVLARGGSGDDMLLGGTADDVLIGGVGDDFVQGGGGDDRILGGPGENTIVSLSLGNSADGTQDSDIGDAGADQPAGDPVSNGSVDDAELVADAPTEESEPDDDSFAEDAATDEVELDTATPLGSTEDVADADADADADVTETVADIVDEDIDEMNVCVAEDAVPDVGVLEPIVPEVDSMIDAETESATPDMAGEFTVDDSVDSDTIHDGLPAVAIGETISVITDDAADAIDPVIEMGEAEVLSEPEFIGELEVAAENDEAESAETDHDIIFGGAGNDWLFGEDGDDLVFGNQSPLEALSLRDLLASRLSR